MLPFIKQIENKSLSLSPRTVAGWKQSDAHSARMHSAIMVKSETHVGVKSECEFIRSIVPWIRFASSVLLMHRCLIDNISLENFYVYL